MLQQVAWLAALGSAAAAPELTWTYGQGDLEGLNTDTMKKVDHIDPAAYNSEKNKNADADNMFKCALSGILTASGKETVYWQFQVTGEPKQMAFGVMSRDKCEQDAYADEAFFGWDNGGVHAVKGRWFDGGPYLTENPNKTETTRRIFIPENEHITMKLEPGRLSFKIQGTDTTGSIPLKGVVNKKLRAAVNMGFPSTVKLLPVPAGSPLEFKTPAPSADEKYFHEHEEL